MGDNESLIINSQNQEVEKKERIEISKLEEQNNSSNAIEQDIVSSIIDNIEKSKKKIETNKVKTSDNTKKHKIYAILFIIFVLAINIFAIVLYQFALSNFSNLFTNPSSPYFFYP